MGVRRADDEMEKAPQRTTSETGSVGDLLYVLHCHLVDATLRPGQTRTPELWGHYSAI